jgi:peptide/nickel transport system permease protein
MISYIGRRLIQTVATLILVSLFAFLLMHMVPGEPVRAMLGSEVDQEQVDKIRHELGLDLPFAEQYLRWISNAARGQLGKSIHYRDDIAETIKVRLPITFRLGLSALLLSALIAIPLGVISAVRRGSLFDSFITLLANLGAAAPVFWLGLAGIYLFGLQLGWLPIQGYTSPFEDFWLSIRQSVMPVMLLAVGPVSSLTRQSRSSMLEVIRQDYIRTAKAKGMTQWSIIVGHALRNAIIPVITLLGLQVRNLAGGAVLVEMVFNIPGMGRMMVEGVLARDFPVVQGCILVVALTVALANLAVDLSYGYIDPRIRLD